MKIAFIHYHLKTGGVTTVLKDQVEALRDVGEVLVLTGDPPDGSFPCDAVYIPGLGYDRPSQKPYDPAEVAEAVVKALYAKWQDGCDVLHVHNATLAKNRNFLKILKLLQKNEVRLFLQIHDFAEDGRPLAYFADAYVPDCHYGVINSRDYEILLKAGLKRSGLHLIPNTIKPFAFERKTALPANRVLYPIRAIRRKNIGEAILLSLFFQNNENLAITLPPNSPADILSHEDWKTFVKARHLNVAFEAGLADDFAHLVRSSRYLITTSITEGFGFSFLEPWTAKKLLWGRKIPDICRDFEENDIQLAHLYTRLRVPVEWVGKKRFYQEWMSCILKTGDLFKYPIQKEDIANAFNAITAGNLIDFKLLHETFQKEVIVRVQSSQGNAKKLIDLNPSLSHPGEIPDREAVIENNCRAVVNNYSKNLYRENLLKIYTRVVEDTIYQHLDKNILLSAFLNLEDFSLLKWGIYVG